MKTIIRLFTHRSICYPRMLDISGRCELVHKQVPKAMAKRILALVEMGWFALPISPNKHDTVFATPGRFDGMKTMLDVFNPKFGWKTECFAFEL